MALLITIIMCCLLLSTVVLFIFCFVVLVFDFITYLLAMSYDDYQLGLITLNLLVVIFDYCLLTIMLIVNGL